MSDKPFRVLDVGSGPASVAAPNFPEDAIITRLDFEDDNNPDMVHDIREPFADDYHESFDVVFASHVLEHVEYWRVDQTLHNLRSVLVPFGQLWVIVPSMDWAAEEILKQERASKAVQGVIMGQQNSEGQRHKNAYTMLQWRALLTRAGFVVRRAFSGQFKVRTESGKIIPAVQNILIAVKAPHNGAANETVGSHAAVGAQPGNPG